MVDDYLADYHEHGYAIVRGVFGRRDIDELAAASDRIYAQGMAHPRSFRHGNSFFQISEDAGLGHIMRMMQWPSYFDSVLNGFRLDRRILEIDRRATDWQ